MKIYKLNLLFDGLHHVEEFFISLENAKYRENLWNSTGAGHATAAYVFTSIEEVEVLNECLDIKEFEIKVISK